MFGCPIYPAAGINDRYFYKKKTGSNIIPYIEVAGFLNDADFLINLSHSKGHGNCAYGGAIKNLAMGGVTANTRRDIHSVMSK